MAPPRSKYPSLLCFCLLLVSTATSLSTPYLSLSSSPSPASDEHTGEDDALSLIRSFRISIGSFSGGGGGLFSPDDDGDVPRSFHLFPHGVSRTGDPNLLHLTATLTLRGPSGSSHGHRHSIQQSVSFVLDGYYSSASLELCMVGTGTEFTDDGSLKHYAGVALRLRVPFPPKLTDPFVTGVLDVAGFNAIIHLVAYSEGDNYKYGERVAATACSPPAGSLQALGADFSCAFLKQQLMSSYRLEHGGAAADDATRMHVNQMQCTGAGVRAYVAFSTGTDEPRYRNRQQQQSYLLLDDDESAVVAEGHWDSARSMICLRACRLVFPRRHTPAVQQECGIRMSFWLPAVWTIRDRSVAAGMIWSSKQGNDAGLISGVMSAWSIEVNNLGNRYRSNLSAADVKYSYNHTAMDEAKKQYLKIKKQQDKKKTTTTTFMAAGNLTYSDMKLDFIAYTGGMGFAYPIAVGEAMIRGDTLTADESLSRQAMATSADLINVSYDIDYLHSTEKRRIAAEGVYDITRGIMCMVGCWRRGNSSTTDCRVLVTVQLPSLDGTTTRGQGVIRSLRKKEDLLFFEGIRFDLYGMYASEMAAEVSRMDLESLLLVLSTTLSCVFAAMQILCAKRNPEAAAATSTTMLAILASGHLVSLVLSPDALFASRKSEYFYYHGGFSVFSSMELNTVVLRVPTLIAFVLHMRLLQLTSSRRRSADRESKAAAASMAERRVLQICVPLYVLGGALAGIVHAVHARAAAENIPVDGGETASAALWEDMVAYLGLVLDGFLLPQTVLNAASGSALPAISPWFYAGGAVLRAAPHAYDAIRARGYAQSVRPRSYIYAGHRGDLFGVAWNVVIPCAVAALALLLFMQQRRVRRTERRSAGGYEMVPPGGHVG